MKPHLKELLWRIPIAAALTAGVMYGIMKAKSGIESVISPKRVTQAVETPKLVSEAEYNSIIQQIKASGYEIDESKSAYVKDAKNLIVFLPDVHVRPYQWLQNKRIKALDNAISFDAIGLEGLVVADAQKAKEVRNKVREFAQKNVIADSQRFEEIKDSDSNIIKLQKGREQFTSAYLQFNDAVYSSVGNQPMVDFLSGAVMRIIGVTPSGWDFDLCAYAGLTETPLMDCAVLNKFNGVEPRVKAPGIAYLDLETRAVKVGMESREVDNASDCLADLFGLKNTCHDIRYFSSRSKKEFEAAKQQYEGKLSEKENQLLGELEAAFDNYLSIFNSNLEDVDSLCKRLAQKLAVLKPEIGSKLGGSFGADISLLARKYPEVVIEGRSRAWAKNMAPYRVSMIVGGADHSDSVYRAAQDNKQSIIALKELKE